MLTKRPWFVAIMSFVPGFLLGALFIWILIRHRQLLSTKKSFQPKSTPEVMTMTELTNEELNVTREYKEQNRQSLTRANARSPLYKELDFSKMNIEDNYQSLIANHDSFYLNMDRDESLIMASYQGLGPSIMNQNDDYQSLTENFALNYVTIGNGSDDLVEKNLNPTSEQFLVNLRKAL